MAKAKKPEVTKKQALEEYLTANPDASAQDAVQAMKKQGFEVTDSVVYNAKWVLKKGKEPAVKKVTVKKAAKVAESAPVEVEVAKTETAPAPATTNKTQAVKDYLAQNPKASSGDISAALKAQGIDVSPGYAAGIKSKVMGKKRKKAKAAAAAPAVEAAAPVMPKDAVSIGLLQKAKKLAAQLGGIKEAKAAMDALAQILD